MTLKEFLKLLATSKPHYRWRIEKVGNQREIVGIKIAAGESYAPTTAVAEMVTGRKYEGGLYIDEAGRDIGLSYQTTDRIVNATDDEPWQDPKIRQLLLKALDSHEE
ncbi:MAG: hypothetical protein HY335_04330 [Deinococcus sp.]|nr:hypothetical protein [Deinococcus sp.]